MCLKNLFSCWLQDSKWYIKVFLQILDFTVPKYKMQYIRTGHPNTLASFLELIRTKRVKSCRLWLPSPSELATETASCRACLQLMTGYSMRPLCSPCPRTLMKQILSLRCLCKLGAEGHSCLPGSMYSSEGHVTALDNILLWAVLQPFPISIFNLDCNKIHLTGK